MNIAEDIKSLDYSIIYHMSLGDKELFHSNLWAWLIEKDHKFSKVFFKDIKGEITKVGREEYHRDLIIHCKENNGVEYEYVIENKMKSLPYKWQLERYIEQDYKKMNCKEHLLTCVTEPSFKLEGSGWKCLLYKDIGTNLLKVLDDDKDQFSPQEYETIKEYCSIIAHISNVFEGLLANSKGNLNYYPGVDLEVIKLADVYKKLKADDFIRYFKENYESKVVGLSPTGYTPNISSGFNNKKSTMDLRFEKKDEDNRNLVVVGVQIEGDSYRIVAERKKVAGQSIDKIFNEFVGYGWFDDTYSCRNKFVFGHPTKMRSNRKYDKYEGSYSFVYQYYNLNLSLDSEESSYDFICKKVIEDLVKAKEIIEKNNI